MQIGHIEDIDQSIRSNQEALLPRPVGHPKHDSSPEDLSMNLLNHFRQTGDIKDLCESFPLIQEAFLQVIPMDHPHRASLLKGVKVDNLAEIRLKVSRAHLRTNCPMGHPDRASSLQFLAGQHKYLDEFICLSAELLLLRPEGHPDRATSLLWLGMGLLAHFRWTGRPENLNNAIQLNQEALLLYPVGDPESAYPLNSLGHLEDLSEFIRLNREALLLRPVGHPCRASSLLSLGAGHLEDLNESIQLIQEVFLLYPVGHLHRLTPLTHFSCLEDLNESIQLNREALLLYPGGHPDRLRRRFKTIGHLDNLNESIKLTRQAVSAVKQAAVDRYSPVSVCLLAVEYWIYFTQPHHDLAQFSLDAYIIGLSLISRSLSMMPVISLQYHHLSSVVKLPEFVSDAASQAIQMDHRTRAGLLWSELRGLRAPMDRLRVMDRPLADELMHINHRLKLLSTKNSVDHDADLPLQTDSHQTQVEVGRDPFGRNLLEKRCLLRAQRDIIEKICKMPGLETFLGRKSFAELGSAAKYGPVIVVNCSKYRSDVLIIEQSTLVLLPMARGFYKEVKALVQRLTEARSNIKAAPKRYNHILRATLHDLWDLVVSPVVTALQKLHIPEHSRIFWCPTSILSTLPLHAAGPVSPGTNKFLPDLYISSYTPTLTALITAFNTARSSAQLPHLLVAGQYDRSLPRTKEEINEVLQFRKHIPITSVKGPAATKEALGNALVDHEWLHIASHGTLVPTEPFSSYFPLATGGSCFTLLDIIRMNLPNATFAFLSACHTAAQSPGGVHNEVIHLAAAMQFCGFQSVVGTMWEMADIDGPEMVKDFYSSVFSNSKEDPSRCNEIGVQARALAEATKKMRGRKGVTLERWVNFVHIGA
ncbi:CHAT domain-containing protein [Rhodocollybia butyracea]|uniref:CHAT domain-containing protein n=1 Tax=Rhodocollybia butyracea TaxID=206335 RepID=A0A9P5P623_9AGAR|nr:CHAT domain-containing protein [Rhodocollybia butyracea]